MEIDKNEWIKKNLIEIFDEKCFLFEESYKNFKLLKKELKAEYFVLNENRIFLIIIVERLILEKNEYENSLKTTITLTQSKSTINHKITTQKPVEKKPEPTRSRTPNRSEYTTNHTKPNDRSRTPMNDKTNLNLKLNRTEKNLINDLKNPRTPLRGNAQEKTPLRATNKSQVKSTLNITKVGSSKSPLNDTKKPNDKKTPIKQTSEKIFKNNKEERDSRSTNKHTLGQKESSGANIQKYDKKESLTKNNYDKRSRDGKREPLSKATDEKKKTDKITIVNKEELKEDSKNNNDGVNKEESANTIIPVETNKSIYYLLSKIENTVNIQQTETPIIEEKTVTLNYPKKKPEEFSTTLSIYKCLIYTATNCYLSNKENYRILTLNKEIYSHFDKTKGILIENIDKELQKNIEEIKDYLKEKENSEFEVLNNKTFVPSKVAQSGLNFFNKEEENNLATKENSPDEILNVFKLIFIMLNENVDHVQPNKYIDYLVTEVFPKYKIESMKSLFIQHLAKNCLFSSKQIQQMQKMIEENPRLLVPNDLLKVNKCVSYMAFMLKEIFEFATMKTADGTFIYMIREYKSKYNELLEKQKRFLEMKNN